MARGETTTTTTTRNKTKSSNCCRSLFVRIGLLILLLIVIWGWKENKFLASYNDLTSTIDTRSSQALFQKEEDEMTTNITSFQSNITTITNNNTISTTMKRWNTTTTIEGRAIVNHTLLEQQQQQNETLLLQQEEEEEVIIHHAIVVPYRKRKEHLIQFIPFMNNYLQTNFPRDNFVLLIIEQGDNDYFNRGHLINVGISEFHQRYQQQQSSSDKQLLHCVVAHDVDLIPAVPNIPYTNCQVPIQLGSELQHFQYKIPYDDYCGGVMNLSTKDWYEINGMSNDYRGWGGEDDDLRIRLSLHGLLHGTNAKGVKIIQRPPPNGGRFDNLEGGAAQPSSWEQKHRHPYYKANVAILNQMGQPSKRDRHLHDGLNDLYYTTLSEITGIDNIMNYLGEEQQQQDNNNNNNGTKKEGGLVETILLRVIAQPPPKKK